MRRYVPLTLLLALLLAGCGGEQAATTSAAGLAQPTAVPTVERLVMQLVQAYRVPGGPPEQVELPEKGLTAPSHRCIGQPHLVRVPALEEEVWWVDQATTGKTAQELANLPPDPQRECLVDGVQLVIYGVTLAPNSEGSGVSVSFTVGNASLYEATVRVSNVILRDEAYQTYTTNSIAEGIGAIILVPGGSTAFTFNADVPPGVTLDTLIVLPSREDPPIFIELPKIRTQPLLAEAQPHKGRL